MFIEKILSQNRRDFTAIYQCEFCNKTEKKSWYDDSYFHNNIIPNMECEECWKKSVTPYNPRATKYQAHEII